MNITMSSQSGDSASNTAKNIADLTGGSVTVLPCISQKFNNGVGGEIVALHRRKVTCETFDYENHPFESGLTVMIDFV